MKPTIALILSAILVLACGMTTLPTQTPVTKTPKVATSRNEITPTPAPTVTDAPRKMIVCAEYPNVNARKIQPDTSLGVLIIIHAGDEVTLTGAEIHNGAEVWQPTDKGLIDPQFLCEK